MQKWISSHFKRYYELTVKGGYCMYLIELVTDRYMTSDLTKFYIGYIEEEDKAKEYCKAETEKLKGTYNEKMGCKYYQYKKIKLITY